MKTNIFQGNVDTIQAKNKLLNIEKNCNLQHNNLIMDHLKVYF
jgi:hypothetical protein